MNMQFPQHYNDFLQTMIVYSQINFLSNMNIYSPQFPLILGKIVCSFTDRSIDPHDHSEIRLEYEQEMIEKLFSFVCTFLNLDFAFQCTRAYSLTHLRPC